MAEEDWYGPFANLNRWHGYAITAAVGGVLELISGVIGYDTGKRSWIVGGPPPPTRWMDSVLWDQIAFGAAMLMIGVVCYYVARRSTRQRR
jgi:hypothetical protein